MDPQDDVPLSQPPLLRILGRQDPEVNATTPLVPVPADPVVADNPQVFWKNESSKDLVNEDAAVFSELGLGLGGAADVRKEQEDLTLEPDDPTKLPKSKDRSVVEEQEMDALTLLQVNYLFVYNLLIVGLIYFEMLEIPFRMAFTPQYPFFYLIVAAVIDLIFCADLGLRFYLPYLHRDGHYVKGPVQKIRLHYLKTWFVPHLIAALPWDFCWLCVFMANPVLGIDISYFRYIRLMRFARLPEVFARLSEWEVSLTWYKNPIWFRVARIVAGLLLWITTNSCIFWLIARAEDFSWNWIVFDAAISELLESTIWVQYLTSIYWGMVTFSTVGYGDIAGSTVGERAYIIFFALLSIAVTAYATGNVVTWLQSAEAKRTVLADQLDEVKGYIKYRRLPPDLGNKLLRFHRFRGLNSVYPSTDSFMLEQLPPSLRFKIVRIFKDTILKNWRMPAVCDTLFLTALFMHMKRETRYPGEFIAHQGAPATRFYILTSGEATVIRNGVEVMQVKSDLGGLPGALFGEMALFRPGTRRTSTLRAVNSCELLYLRRKDLMRLLKQFPDHQERIRLYAESLDANQEKANQEKVNAALHRARHHQPSEPSEESGPSDPLPKSENLRTGSANVNLMGDAADNKTKLELPETGHKRSKSLHEPVLKPVVPEDPQEPQHGSDESTTDSRGKSEKGKEESEDESEEREEEKGLLRRAGHRKTALPVIADPSLDRIRGSSATPPSNSRSHSSDGLPARRRGNKGGIRFSQKSPRSDKKGGFRTRPRRGSDVHQPSAEELIERVRKLPKIESRMFEQDILNDPVAVGKVMASDPGGIAAATFFGAQVIDWVAKKYGVNRLDGLYLAQRMLRTHVCFYAVGENVDIRDDFVTRFRLVKNYLSKDKVMSLLNVDVVGGTVTKQMEQIITSSVDRPFERSAEEHRMHGVIRAPTVMNTNFTVEEDTSRKRRSKGRARFDEDSSSE